MSDTLIHPQAACLAKKVGARVSVGPFSRIAESVQIGDGVAIGANVSVPDGVIIDTGAVIDDGAVLAPGMTIGAGARIGSGVVFAARRLAGEGERDPDDLIVVGAHCVIGANATICAGLRLGDHSVVDAGSVLSRSTQPYSIMAGNPAKVVGFSGVSENNETPPHIGAEGEYDSRVRGVRTYRLPYISDPRGNLTVGEFGRSLPFQPKRYFVTFDVPSAHLRGEHAHRACDQFLICVRGSCALVVDDGENREEFQLDHPTFGVWVPKMTWATEYKHSPDSVLLVFASDYYDPDDYIRDYPEFMELVRSRKA